MVNIFRDIGKAFSDIWKGVQQVFTEVISWFVPIPELPQFDQDLADQNARGVLLNKQSNNAHIPVVYGERLVGGTRIFLEVSGTDNQYLYGAIVLCEGKINNITQIRVNDDAVTFSGSIADGTQITSNDSRFGTTITIQPFFGGDSQSASSLLSTLTNWGSNHKLSGVAYIAFRIEWDADKYTSIPNIQAKVQGKLISTYDGSSNETTNQYSTNPAFILLNYLTDTRFGKSIPIANIDIPSFYNCIYSVCYTDNTL